MTKKALIINGVVDSISMEEVEGWVPVPGDVFAGFVENGDGTFSPPAPVAPSTDPNEYPLRNDQFRAALKLMGIALADIENAIDTVITDPLENAQAHGKVRGSHTYNRDHPLFTTLAPHMGLSDAQIDIAWMQAKDF